MNIWLEWNIKLVVFRDSTGQDARYEAVAVLEYKGTMDLSGESRGHYICDVRQKDSKQIWFRTNDNSDPIVIQEKDVSKYGYAILFKRLTM